MHDTFIAPERQGGALARVLSLRLGRWPLLVTLALMILSATAIGQLLSWFLRILLAGGSDAYVRGATDFLPTLTGGRLIREGQGAHLYDFEAQRLAQIRVLAPDFTPGTFVNIYNHPPAEALLVAPLINLPGVAFWLWTLGALLAFAAGLWLLARAWPIPTPLRWVVIAAACAYYPVHLALWLGQNTAFVFLGCCGVWAGRHRDQPWLVGLSLPLIALKPQFLPVVIGLLLLERCWKALLVAAGLLTALVVAAMPILGVAWPLHYARFVLVDSNRGAAVAEKPMNMINWRGLMVNLVGDAAPGLVTPLFALLSVLTIGAFLLVWWRSRHAGPAASEAVWALALLVAVLIAPHLNPHDLSVLIVPSWIVTSRVVAGAWGVAAAPLWFGLLWAGFWAAPLALSQERVPAISVVPSVLLLVVMAGLLAWQSMVAAPRPSATPALA